MGGSFPLDHPMTFRRDALCAREAEDAPARQPDFLDESRERLSTQVTRVTLEDGGPVDFNARAISHNHHDW